MRDLCTKVWIKGTVSKTLGPCKAWTGVCPSTDMLSVLMLFNPPNDHVDNKFCTI